MISYYEPHIRTAQDYYPFGMLMPGRKGFASGTAWVVEGSGSSLPASVSYGTRSGNTPLEYKASSSIEFTEGFESGVGDEFVAYITTDGGSGGSSGIEGGERTYRYGFNGKENDNEVKGEGNQQDYGMRIYDPRLGRFLSMDPIASDYPFYTPYQFAGNKPIIAADLDGLEEWMKTQEFAMKRQAQLQLMSAQKKLMDVGTIRTYDPANRTWTQKWRDSKSFVAQVTYRAANGLYTLPQQLGSGITGQEQINNIGGNTHDAHGIFGEKERVENAIDGLTTLMPSAAAEQKGASILNKYVKKVMTNLENQVTEQVTKRLNIVKITDIEDDVMVFTAKVGEETVEGITNFAVKDEKLFLDKLHLQGSSAGKVGREELWKIAKDLGKQYKVKEVVVQGGKRTTGKYKGQTPSPQTIKVD